MPLICLLAFTQTKDSIGQPGSKYATAIGVPAAGIDRHHDRALCGHSVHERLELVRWKRLKASNRFKKNKRIKKDQARSAT